MSYRKPYYEIDRKEEYKEKKGKAIFSMFNKLKNRRVQYQAE